MQYAAQTKYVYGGSETEGRAATAWLCMGRLLTGSYKDTGITQRTTTGK